MAQPKHRPHSLSNLLESFAVKFSCCLLIFWSPCNNSDSPNFFFEIPHRPFSSVPKKLKLERIPSSSPLNGCQSFLVVIGKVLSDCRLVACSVILGAEQRKRIHAMELGIVQQKGYFGTLPGLFDLHVSPCDSG